MRKNDYVIIMAGGIGSRFWPMSRTSYPKQFHDILGTGQSMIQMTYERIAAFIPTENIFIVTNERYGQLVHDQLPQVRPQEVLLEPVGRNTAPCIAYAIFKIRNRNPSAAVLVVGSDYLIHDSEAFRKDAELALDACSQNPTIMTLGIPPAYPNTGYGYIQYIEDQEGVEQDYYKVKTFTEKPTLELAKTFLQSGDFLWNSGMFIFSLPTILEAYKSFLPDMYEIFDDISGSMDTDEEGAVISQSYSMCRNISVDDGIMEKAENIHVIKAHFDWSDLGTWGSVYEQIEKDYLQNASQGNLMIFKSSNNMVRVENKEKLVVLHGLDDFIVVDTDDVLLICKKENEQEIKTVVKEVKKNSGEKYA